MRAMRKGKQMVAIMTPTTGSGLKSKYGVSENGSDIICIRPDIVSQTGKIPNTTRTGYKVS